MKTNRFALYTVVVFCAAVNGTAYSRQADVNDQGLLSLSNYLRYAARNNAGLKAAFEQWKAALEQVPQAKSLPDPRFTYGYFIDEVETRVGPQEQKFEIMQIFPWFGTIEARTDEAAARAQAAHKRYEAKKLELFQQVKYVFYEYSYLSKAIEITGQNLELITHFEEIARSRYTAAIISHPDIIRAQIELAVLEDRLESLKEFRPAITARLNSILNRPASSGLPWPRSPEYQSISIDFPRLYAIMTKNNPELQALGHDIEAARSREKLAQKKFYPNVGIGLGYIDTAGARSSDVEDSGKDPVIAMISLTLPIWSDSYKAAERQARAQLRQRTHEKTQMENTLAARAQRLLYEFEDSDRKIRLYRDVIISKAREMLAASETAYQAGTIDFLSLVDAQRTLLKYELYYERLVAENGQKLAELEMLAGTRLATGSKEPSSE